MHQAGSQPPATITPTADPKSRDCGCLRAGRPGGCGERRALPGHAGKPILGASGTGELEPERIPGSQRLRLSHPQSRPQALALRDEATEKTQTRAAARAPGQSHKQSLLQTPTPRKEAGRKWSC